MRTATALALAVAVSAPAQPIPLPQGNVSDFAGALTPAAETRLEASIRRLREIGVHAAVATIQRAHPRTPKQWAVDAFQKWGPGEAGVDNGLLVLLSVGDRRVEIEVGYGLEGRLTDAQAGELLDEYAVPAFQKGEWGLGLARTLLGLTRHFEVPSGVPRFGLPAAAPEGLWTLGLRVAPDDRARIQQALAALAPTGVAVTLAGVRSPAATQELASEVTRRWVPLAPDAGPRVVVLLHGSGLRVRTTPHPPLQAVREQRGRWLADRVRPFLRSEDPDRARLPGVPAVPGVEGAALAALAEGLAESLGVPLAGPDTLTRRAALLERTREVARARLRAAARERRLAARPYLPCREFRDTWPDLAPWQLLLGEATRGGFWVSWILLLLVVALTIPYRVVRLAPSDATTYPKEGHRSAVQDRIGEGLRLVDPPLVSYDAWWVAFWFMVPAAITGWETGTWTFLLGIPLLLLGDWRLDRVYEGRGRCPCCDRSSWGLRHRGAGLREVGIACRDLQGPSSVEAWWLGDKGPAARHRPRVSMLGWLLRLLAAGLVLAMCGAVLAWGGPWRWVLVLGPGLGAFCLVGWLSLPRYRAAPTRWAAAHRPSRASRASSYTAASYRTPTYTSTPTYASTPTTSSTNSWTSYSSSSSSSSSDDDDDWSSYGGGSSGGGGAGRSF